MAKSSFTHSCGHPGRCDGRNRADADRHAEWLTRQVCWECEKAARSQTARAKAQALALPQLTGSPKQVAWAEQIRVQQLLDLDAAAEKLSGLLAGKLSSEQSGEVTDAIALIRAEFCAHTDADAWIDRRDMLINHRWLAKQISERGLAPSCRQGG